jgi:U3 small nucleolar RNA-associated protein 23
LLLLLRCSMPHLQELLARLLGGDVKLFTTPCISKELKALGPDFAATAAAARQEQLHKCEHSPPEPPSDCLLAAVRGGNKQHWWVATQDKALQAELGSMQAVPVLFASVNGLHLAEPPEQAKAAIAAGHAAAQALPRHELASEPLRDLAELRPKDESWKKFRRKKVKGPNPLAVRKKQPKQQQAAGGAAAAAAAGEGDAKAAARRKRKKHKEQQQQQQQQQQPSGAG